MERKGMKVKDRKNRESGKEAIRCRCGRPAIVRLGQCGWVCERHAFDTKLKEVS